MVPPLQLHNVGMCQAAGELRQSGLDQDFAAMPLNFFHESGFFRSFEAGKYMLHWQVCGTARHDEFRQGLANPTAEVGGKMNDLYHFAGIRTIWLFVIPGMGPRSPAA